MKIRHYGLAAMSLSILLCPLALSAQDTSSQHMDNGAQKMMKSADTKFAMMAAQGGMAEVKLGQLAATKGQNADVKAFGQKMVDDHTKANDQLTSIAQGEGLTLPSTLDPKDQAMYDKLSGMSGAAFDKAYMTDMVKDHEKDIKDFQKEANSGQDPKIKDFASTTLPTLQTHLQMAQQAQQKVKSGGM